MVTSRDRVPFTLVTPCQVLMLLLLQIAFPKKSHWWLLGLSCMYVVNFAMGHFCDYKVRPYSWICWFRNQQVLPLLAHQCPILVTQVPVMAC